MFVSLRPLPQCVLTAVLLSVRPSSSGARSFRTLAVCMYLLLVSATLANRSASALAGSHKSGQLAPASCVHGLLQRIVSFFCGLLCVRLAFAVPRRAACCRYGSSDKVFAVAARGFDQIGDTIHRQLQACARVLLRYRMLTQAFFVAGGAATHFRYSLGRSIE